uniref:Lysosomal acid phosphatase n=1 Tax=Angiostrongylus cantonensis TaxID=6313 RepID=A0A158PC23_ANGCA
MVVRPPTSVLLQVIFLIRQLPQSLAARNLVFVQAIWRHGDRAPQSLPYPNDPYDETAWHRGWGELTNIGIEQMNELGMYFRTRYDFFISSHYVPSEVYIRSSDSNRALTSAQAFLAGFYPASGSFQWQSGNHWQPTAVHATSPGEPDLLLKPTSVPCKNLDKLVDEDYKRQARHFGALYAEMFKLLGEQTGIANFSYTYVSKINDVTKELIHNMWEKQPLWIFKHWPQYNDHSTLDIITELRRIQRITKFNSTAKAKHDGTLLSLMYVMGVANDQLVPYASSLIMEIYKNESNFEVEVSHLKYENAGAKDANLNELFGN